MVLQRNSSKTRSVMDTLDTYKNMQLRVIKKTKIKDLLKNPDYKRMSRITCHRRLPYLSTKASDKICECLNQKNGNMTVEELELATESRKETPGSVCISMYDKLKRESTKRKCKSKCKKSHRLSKKNISKRHSTRH